MHHSRKETLGELLVDFKTKIQKKSTSPTGLIKLSQTNLLSILQIILQVLACCSTYIS